MKVTLEAVRKPSSSRTQAELKPNSNQTQADEKPITDQLKRKMTMDAI